MSRFELSFQEFSINKFSFFLGLRNIDMFKVIPESSIYEGK